MHLAWKESITAVCTTVETYHRMFEAEFECQNDVIYKLGSDNIFKLFDDIIFRQKYIPSGIVIVDNSPLDLNYKSNIDIMINGHEKPTVFASYDKKHQLQAISFGAAAEMDITMDTLKYTIDYYGFSNLNSLVAHTIKHISTIPSLLKQSQTANDAYVYICLMEGTFSQSVINEFNSFMSTKLLLNNKNTDMPLERQFVVEMKHPLITRRGNKL